MTDYSATLIQLIKLSQMYRKAVLKREYDLSADIAVDMGVLCCELQEWSEIKVEESR